MPDQRLVARAFGYETSARVLNFPMSIHERARQMVAQSRRPMSVGEAYSLLGRRSHSRKREVLGVVRNSPELNSHLATVERPREMRLPYRDD